MFRLFHKNVEELEEKEADDIIETTEHIATYARGIRAITRLIRSGRISTAKDLKYYNYEIKELVKALTNELLTAYEKSMKLQRQEKKKEKREIDTNYPCPKCGKACDHVKTPHSEVISCDHWGYDNVKKF